MLKTSHHLSPWVMLLLLCFPPLSLAANVATDKEYTFTLKSWTVTKTNESDSDKNLGGEYRITFGNTTHCFDHQLEYHESEYHEGWIGWKKPKYSGCGQAKVLYGKQSLGDAFDLEQGFAKQEGNWSKIELSYWLSQKIDYYTDSHDKKEHKHYEVNSNFPKSEKDRKCSDSERDMLRQLHQLRNIEYSYLHNNESYLHEDCSSTTTYLGPLTLYQPEPTGSVSLYSPVHANGNELISFTVWEMNYGGTYLWKYPLYHSQKPDRNTGVFKLTAKALVALDTNKDGIIKLPLKTSRQKEQLTLALGYVAKPQLPNTLKDDIAALKKVLSHGAKQNLEQAEEQWLPQANFIDPARQPILPKTLFGIDAVWLDAPGLLNMNPVKVPRRDLHPKILEWIKAQAPNARWLFKNQRQEVGTAAITEDLTQLKWHPLSKPTGAQSVQLYYLDGGFQKTIQSRCRPLYQIILSTDFERLKQQSALLVFHRGLNCQGEVVGINPLRTTPNFGQAHHVTIQKPILATNELFSKTYSSLTLALRWQGQKDLTTISVSQAQIINGQVSLPKGNYSLSQDNLTVAIVEDAKDLWEFQVQDSTLTLALIDDRTFKQQWHLRVKYPTGLDNYTWQQLCPIKFENATAAEWIDYLKSGAKVVCPYLQETKQVELKLIGRTIEVGLTGHQIRFLLRFKDTHYHIADWTIQRPNKTELEIPEADHLGYVEMSIFDLFPNKQSTQFTLLSPKLIYQDIPFSLTHEQQRQLFKTGRNNGLSDWTSQSQSVYEKLTIELNNPTERLAETHVDSNGLWSLMNLDIQLANRTTLKNCRLNTSRIACSNKNNLTLAELAGARLTLNELGDSVRLSQTPTNRALKAVYCGRWSKIFRAQRGRLVIRGASHQTNHLYMAKPEQMELYFTPMPGTGNWWLLDVGTDYLNIPIDGLRGSDKAFRGETSDKPKKSERWCQAFDNKPCQDCGGYKPIPPKPIDDQRLQLSFLFENYEGHWNPFWNQPQMRTTLLTLFQRHQTRPMDISLWFAKPDKSTQTIEFESRSRVAIKEVITSGAVYDKIHEPISAHPYEEPAEIVKPIQTILTQFKAKRRWSANSDQIVVLFTHKLESIDLQFDWTPLTTANGLRHFVILTTERIAKTRRDELSKQGVTVIRLRGQWIEALNKQLDKSLQSGSQ